MPERRSVDWEEDREADARQRVSDLASRALKVLASRRRSLSEDFVARVRGVALDGTRLDRLALVDEMERSGITREEICDQYIPEVARRLGEEWCDDEMSFADVTIGSARLQALLRDIGVDEAPCASEKRGQIAVMLLADKYHTLGAMVLTGQLRRIGISVRLILGRPADEVGTVVAGGGFDAVLLSVALKDDIEEVAAMIRTIRQRTGGQVPLIVGGGIIENGCDAVRAATGADHVTNDVREALRLSGCELKDDLAR